jgi:hypothetical protein
MTKALELARASASARRNYADQQTIDQYTQQLNALIKAEMTCKGVNQTIPMKLVTSKFGVDYWTMPAFNFADENGHVSLVDLLDAINCPALKHGRRRCWRRYETLTKANRKDIN